MKTRRNIPIVSLACLVALAALSCSTVTQDGAAKDNPAYADASMDIVLASPPQETPQEKPKKAGDVIKEIKERQDLLKQKNAVMVGRYLKNAEALKEQGKYDEAELQLSEALKIAPANNDVLKALREIESLLGKTPGEISDVKRLATERHEVRKQQLKFSALSTFEDGKKLMDRGDYDRAILYFERVLNQIHWDVDNVDWGSLESDVEAKLSEAKRLNEKKKAEERRTQESKAFEVIKSEEIAQKDQTELQKSLLLQEAIDK